MYQSGLGMGILVVGLRKVNTILKISQVIVFVKHMLTVFMKCLIKKICIASMILDRYVPKS